MSVILGMKYFMKKRRKKMNDKLRKVLNYRYNAEIQDALYKIQCFSEQELLIPEHPDITGEIDKLLEKISQAEEKMAVIELHYGEKEADKTVL
jgi:hypothetical protein